MLCGPGMSFRGCKAVSLVIVSLPAQIVVAVIVYCPPVWLPERVVFEKSRSISMLPVVALF